MKQKYLMAVLAAGMLVLAGCGGGSGGFSQQDLDDAKTEGFKEGAGSVFVQCPEGFVPNENDATKCDADLNYMSPADTAAMSRALHAALGGPDSDSTPPTYALANIAAPALSNTGLAVDAAAGAGSHEETTNPGNVELKAGESVGMLGVGWRGMDYAGSATVPVETTDEARVYTNQGTPKLLPFADAGHTVTDGAVSVETANLGLVMANAFMHSGTQQHGTFPDTVRNLNTLRVRGTYDGAKGEFRCTGACSSTNDGSGSPSALGGTTWSFVPDEGAMVSRPDAHYLYFGWWVSKDSDGSPLAASAFAGRAGTDTGDSMDGLDPAGDLATIGGSATYAGAAVGKFAMNNQAEGTGSSGHFTADAELKATFAAAAEDGGVTGTIDNFRLNDGSEDPGWIVSLARGDPGSAGAITAPAQVGGASVGTVWSINGNKAAKSGTWSGTMYDESPGNAPDGDGSNVPTTVIGTFYSEFGDSGRMVGAFGANRQ